MITKKTRPRPYSRMKNGKSMASSEQLSAFDSSRQENSRARSQNGHRNYQHLFDKYTTMAREALSCGDRVAAEFHYQHADHYLRLLNERQTQRAFHQTDKNQEREDHAPPVETTLENEIKSNTEQDIPV